MKKSDVNCYPQGSQKYVIMHAAYQRSRGRKPSVSYQGERNPIRALRMARGGAASNSLCCDRCGLPCPPHNDAAVFDMILLHDLSAIFAMARHLLPVYKNGKMVCSGSPSRAQYIHGQPRDTRTAYAYNPIYEEPYRKAYNKLQRQFGTKGKYSVTVTENPSGRKHKIPFAQLSNPSVADVLAVFKLQIPAGSSCFVNGKMIAVGGAEANVPVNGGDKIVVADNATEIASTKKLRGVGVYREGFRMRSVTHRTEVPLNVQGRKSSVHLCYGPLEIRGDNHLYQHTFVLEMYLDEAHRRHNYTLPASGFGSQLLYDYGDAARDVARKFCAENGLTVNDELCTFPVLQFIVSRLPDYISETPQREEERYFRLNYRPGHLEEFGLSAGSPD